MRKMTYEELLMYHEIALDSEGVEGILNESILHSAINNPYATAFGEELYPTNEEKIAMTVFSLIKGHGFRDANKRTGILILKAMLFHAEINIEATDDDYIQLALDIATSKYKKEDIVNWINKFKI